MLTIQFIGSGSAFSKKHGQTNILFSQNNTHLMLDFGFRAPEGLAGNPTTMKDLTHVLISHIHADHVGGLEELAFLSLFVFKRKLILLMPGDLEEQLWEQSLRGGLEWISDENGHAKRCTLNTFFDVRTLDPGWTQISDFKIKAFPVDHVPGKECYGFIVEDIKTCSRAIFTCDVRNRLPELCAVPLSDDFAKGVIFHDCQLFDDGLNRVHIPINELIKYPKTIRERIFVTHYGDNIHDHLEHIHMHDMRVIWPKKSMTLYDLNQSNAK